MAENKIRLDQFLYEYAYFESRQQAQTAIMTGGVKVAGKPATKAGTQLNLKKTLVELEKSADYVQIVSTGVSKYVSRGAYKLEKAHKEFNLDLNDSIVFDIGASTGGFTDFSLQHGAKWVIALDVGTNQLHAKLKQNSQVISLEKTNIKDFSYTDLKELAKENAFNVNDIGFVVADLSFISILKIVTKLKELFSEAEPAFIFLLKPQFEGTKELINKCKGIIRDDKVRLGIKEEVLAKLANEFEILSCMESPIKGAKGNIEYLVHFRFK
jgi:23S rRNA (cytidine1920-2'-O)/16S rRNA (cytidine1409-2'-O)-methyltransferase